MQWLAELPAFVQAGIWQVAFELGRPAFRCHCVLEGPAVDDKVLSLLKAQLERCGPENLCPPASAAFDLRWALLAAVLVFALGFTLGLLAAGRHGRFVGGAAGAGGAAPGPQSVPALLPRTRGHLARAPLVMLEAGRLLDGVYAGW